MKEGFSKEDISFLRQLIDSLEEAEKKLGVAYEKKNYEGVNMLKDFILKAQKKINGVLK